MSVGRIDVNRHGIDQRIAVTSCHVCISNTSAYALLVCQLTKIKHRKLVLASVLLDL